MWGEGERWFGAQAQCSRTWQLPVSDAAAAERDSRTRVLGHSALIRDSEHRALRVYLPVAGA